MSLLDIIDQATADGVTLRLSVAGKILVSGDKEPVHRWMPVLADHKDALLAALTASITGNTDVTSKMLTPSCGKDGTAFFPWESNFKSSQSSSSSLSTTYPSPESSPNKKVLHYQGVSKDDKHSEHIREQFNCQAFEHNGVLMSTHESHCRPWHCPWCKGCILVLWVKDWD